MADRLDRVELPELLEAVVRALREEGAEAEADHLDSVSTCAYTTSSEYLGEVGQSSLAGKNNKLVTFWSFAGQILTFL